LPGAFVGRHPGVEVLPFVAADAASAVLLFRMSQAYTRRQARTQRHLHVLDCVRCAERQRCAAAARRRCAGPKAPTGDGHDESVGVRAPVFVEPMRDCGMHWVRCGVAVALQRKAAHSCATQAVLERA
jgi:hypothetical protein